MKLGTENRTQLMALGVLAVVAVLLLARAFWPSEPSTAAAPVTTASIGSKPAMRRTASGKLVPVSEPRLDPTLNFDLLRQSEEIKYAGNGRNIFMAGSVPIEKPLKNGTDQASQTPAYTPPVITPPPPINLKFYGFASKPGEPKKVFLLKGEDMFIAGEGDIVDRQYRVVRITNTPPAVDVEDVLNNHRQSLPLVQG